MVEGLICDISMMHHYTLQYTSFNAIYRKQLYQKWMPIQIMYYTWGYAGGGEEEFGLHEETFADL